MLSGIVRTDSARLPVKVRILLPGSIVELVDRILALSEMIVIVRWSPVVVSV